MTNAAGLWSIDEKSLAAFSRALGTPPDGEAWFSLRRAAEELALVPGFESLIALDANAIKELPHQIDVAQRVLRTMGGRAILADEVGLGKTIEAGIILKELAVRGLARRILILTPAALVDQWQGELESKFFERFETPQVPDDWRRTPRAIVSYHRAVREHHQRAILEETWDLVILDEAHKVKNHKSSTYEFISKIERNFILLLTATPLQNDLRELYNLITLLRPGQLGTWREFSARHLAMNDRRRVRSPEQLRELTSEVMVRTRRSSVAQALALPRRIPVHPNVRLTRQEASLYGATVSFLRELYAKGFIEQSFAEATGDRRRRPRRTGKGIQALEVIRLCQRLCSSTASLGKSLERFAEGELVTPAYRKKALGLAGTAAAISGNAKLDALDTVLNQHREQVIVFSEHLPTLQVIAQRVRAHGRQPILYQGGLSRHDRARRLQAFKAAGSGVFVSTRAGTEGLNLQFCNVLVNYELPWNPMVVEQRIGRIHRIGQTRDAYIINLAAHGTIEAHILRLLDEKIRLFELVVGELDVILGDFGGSETLEQRLAAEFLSAEDDGAFDDAVERMGADIVRSREAGMEQERLNSELSSNDSATRLAREFAHLTIPARVRLGYGTKHLAQVEGVEAMREHLVLHVNEIMEALEGADVADGEHSEEYGALVNIAGATNRGRAVHLTVQADRLPMLLVRLDAELPR
ncbi:MAG: DEAD/DEAH box helicase [Gemmatimonadaceae bacterium]|nr:DEAD/DEAH box helicase [Gemmatimonadaceae bacterium]